MKFNSMRVSLLLIFLNFLSIPFLGPVNAYDLISDGRIVRSMAALDILTVTAGIDYGANNSWIIGRIVPQTPLGQPVYSQNPDKSWVLNMAGEFRIVTALQGKVALSTLPYKIQQPVQRGKVGFSFALGGLDTPYMVFDSPGTVVANIQSDAETPINFRPLYFCPDEWAGDIASAVKYVQDHRFIERLDSNNKTDQTFLLNLLQDKNPLLSIWALRTIIKNNGVNGDVIDAALKDATKYQLAVASYLLLEWASRENANAQQQLSDKLLRSIDAKTPPPQLEGIALGVFTAGDPVMQSLAQAFDPSVTKLEMPIIQSIHDLHSNLPEPQQSDIATILYASGYRNNSAITQK